MMTLRMSTLFDDSFRAMIKNLNSAKRRSNKDKDNVEKKRLSRSTRNNGAGPSTSRINHHSGDSDDDDGDHRPLNGKAGRSRRAHAQSNGVSSSSQTRDALPSSNKRLRPSRLKSSDDEDGSSDSSSESSDNSEDSSGIPLADLGKSPKKAHKRLTTQKRATVSSSSAKRKSRNTKRRKVDSDEEPEPENSDNESCDKSRSSPEPKSSRRSGRMAPNRRLQSSSDDNGSKSNHNDKQRRTSRRPKRYESDQSFHVEAPNRNTADSDSDKPRATRESAKKKFIEWAITSGDEDDDDEDFEQKPQTSSQALRSAARQSARKKAIRSDSDQSDKKSKPVPSRRSTRTQRVSQSQSQSQSQDDESEDDSDEQDKPSTSTSVRSSRHNGQPIVQTSATLRTTRSSQNQQAPRSSTGNTDHNYGEPGPSSLAVAPPRQTRSTMILSRHQRNADELDRSGLEDSTLATNNQNTRLLRLRSVNLRAAPTPASNFEALNGIRRTMRNRATHNYYEDENENDAEDTANRFQPSHQNQVRTRVTRQEPPEDPSEDSDSFSDEDKTPLKSMASSSKKTHEHNTRRGSAAVNRVKRNLYSDDEQVCCTI